ncbi:hydroxyacid dehydrogenase, partial [Candidatus Woesearchaeota archaeon]|nr:hydroxyacid dehydrogenase [Candidatus Woesearchaeota archaeon]
MAKIAFFRLEKWEEEYIKEHLKGHELVFADKPLTGENVGNFKDVEAVGIFLYSKINQDILSKLPGLKFVATMSTGFDHIDLDACRKKKVVVSNVPAYGDNTVAEHAMGLLLAISKHLVESVERTRKGDFSLEGLRGFDLKGKTVGIIGTGKIGSHMARFARAFDMRVIAFDKFPNESVAKEYGFSYVPLDKLFAESDVISLHLPENPETHHTINKDNYKKIKKGCVLINTARGSLVESEAILLGLKEGVFSAAGLDVLEEECAIREEKELV